MRATVLGLYEDVYGEVGEYPHAPPEDLIGPISMALAEANDKRQNFVLLPKIILLYILEFTRVYKVGSPFGLHAGMEWPSMQISLALTTLMGQRPLLYPYTEDNGTVRTTFFRFSTENPAGKDLDFESDPESKEPFLRYSMAFYLQNKPNEPGGAVLPTLEDLADGITREMKNLAFVPGDARRRRRRRKKKNPLHRGQLEDIKSSRRCIALSNGEGGGVG